MTKRQFLGGLGSLTAGILGAGAVKTAATGTATAEPTGGFPYQLTEEEWRARLSPEAYRVLRAHGTERAGTSPINAEKRQGVFACAGCGHPLFDSKTKYESGTGWPSFWQPLPDAVGTTEDRSLWMVRTEVHCANCGGHLGHVFPDGPAPTGLRYCMNGVSLAFRPAT